MNRFEAKQNIGGAAQARRSRRGVASALESARRIYERAAVAAVAMITLVVLVIGTGAVSATSADAATGAGAGFCAPYGGLSTSQVSVNSVYPCANPNISDSFGFQCVEFSVRFEAVTYGVPPSWANGGPGAGVVNLLHQHGIPAGSPNGSAAGSTTGTNLPTAGDVISMWGSGQESVGHTGVVASVIPTGGTGNFTISYDDENGSLSNGRSIGTDSIKVVGWVWQPAFSNAPYRYNVYNWTLQTGWAGVGYTAVNRGSSLVAGQSLTPGQYLVSADVRTVLILQTDGNLVEYNYGRAVWSSSTNGQPIKNAIMQGDGNFVIYRNDNSWAWQTNTPNSGATTLSVQDDANVVLYTPNAVPKWATSWHGVSTIAANAHYLGASYLSSQAGSVGPNQVFNTLPANDYLRSPDGRYALLMQADGNVVLYGPGYHVLWASNTNGQPTSSSPYNQLVMQADSNLVLYPPQGPGHAIWPQAYHSGAVEADLQSDGNFVLYNTNNQLACTGCATYTQGRA
jgi:hypothetical protein